MTGEGTGRVAVQSNHITYWNSCIRLSFTTAINVENYAASI